MLEHRSVIRCLLKTGLAAIEIQRHWSEVNGAELMKKTQALHSVRRIWARRENLSDGAQSGRRCQINPDTLSAHKLQLNPHTQAPNLALLLSISVQAMTNRLHSNLGMKFYHIQCISYGLDHSTSGKRALGSNHA
jgi:hypothetical protein